ncbi:MAG: prepilin-type N-terminal cleavage/methylation domain-containing protein [Actinobacteria bacterium]|nr:prepilin-type N-terminal cleavage/methylation domain-containing protein [Actinomycetota bacterium]MCB9412576.1 prepilin-type N-terminal cleavage/methylation domain-containing protein [Actinomycetota bacterium]
MYSAIRKLQAKRAEGEEGFTLIELLVVIIIIGILAAIAIPVFLNQREKGWDAQAESDVRNGAIAEETYFTENGTYAPADGLVDWDTSADVTASAVTVSGDGNSYCISATSKSGTTFAMSSETGAPAEGTCLAGAFVAP